MTTPSAARLLRATAAAGAVGALTLVEPRRLGPWSRGAWRAGTAVLTGLLVADSARDGEALLDPVRDGVVAGGVTLGTMDLLERCDRMLVDGLRSAGIPRPRLLLAALGAAGAAALVGLPGRGGAATGWALPEEVFPAAQSAPAPPEVRALLDALLAPLEDGTDLPGAAALREQAETVRTVDPGYPTCDVQLEAVQVRRLAVPRQQLWPVAAAFDRGGMRFELQLQIEDGRLGMLSVMVGDDEPQTDAALDLLASDAFALPDPDRIALHRETETP